MRSGRNSLGFGAVLLAGFVGLGIYHHVNRDRYQANAQLLEDLQGAVLARVEEKPLGQPGDWPQWRGPLRDGISRETGLLAEWPAKGPERVWQVPLGRGYSSLAVAAGRIFTQMQDGPNEIVVCLDAASGKEIWRLSYPCDNTGDPTYGPCPRSTPTVDGDCVYTVGGNGLLHCLRANDGQIVWQHDLLSEFGARLPQWGVAFSPLIEGDLVITHPGGAAGNSIVAFHKGDGTLAWQSQVDAPGYSSPIAVNLAGRRQLLMFTGKAIVSLAPADGQLYWRFPWPTAFNCNVATPIVRGDYVFLSSGYGKGCALLKVTANGRSLTAEPVYESNALCSHFSSCVLVEEHIYGFSDQTLTCMELRTGEVAWTKNGFFRGSLLAADGKLVILGEKGQLALAEATPAEYRELASFRFSNRRCWSVPVLAQGKLFVRDEDKLVCFNVKK